MDRNKDGVWRVRGGSSDRNPIFMRRFGRVNISSAFNLAGTRARLLAGGTHDCSDSRLFISQLSMAKCWNPPIHWLDFFFCAHQFRSKPGHRRLIAIAIGNLSLAENPATPESCTCSVRYAREPIDLIGPGPGPQIAGTFSKWKLSLENRLRVDVEWATFH